MSTALTVNAIDLHYGAAQALKGNVPSELDARLA